MRFSKVIPNPRLGSLPRICWEYIVWLVAPTGRVSRWQYFLINLLNIAISLVVGFLVYGLIRLFAHDEIPTTLGTPGDFVDLRFAIRCYVGIGLSFYLTFILICKRLHDMNCTAWLAILFQLLLFVRGINLIAGLVLLFTPGRNYPGQNSNRYGIDPRA
jgi:uncharacterized membrane protein YhaH (DUF805 family)